MSRAAPDQEPGREIGPALIAQLFPSLDCGPAYSEVDWDGLVERVGALAREGEIRIDRVVRAGDKEACRNVRLYLGKLVEDLDGTVSR